MSSHTYLYRCAGSAALLRAVALLLAALCLGCPGLSGLSGVEPPEVSVSNVTPVGMDGFESRVRVDLRLSNPNEFALEIDGLRFQLDVNGRRFARGQTDELVQLPRLGDGRVSVEVTTGLGDVLRQIAGMTGTMSDLRYRISGDLFLTQPEKRILPFEYDSEEGDR